MCRVLHLLVLAGVFALALQAQSSNGYLFFAPGGVTCCGTTSMTLHAGVGGEGVIGKGIGIGAELGAVGPRDELADSVGMFSPNGYYHFVHRKELKADPFVTAGYTLMFRSGHANLFNFGTGLNYWFLNHLGARVEFRDHVYHSGRAVHYWGVRFGLAFR